MPKCDKCGKKFQTLSALNDHYRAVHPNLRFVAPKTSSSRNLVIGLVIVIIVVGALVGVLIILQQTQHPTTTTTNSLDRFLNQPISSTLYNQMTGVSASTLSAVGIGQLNNKPTAISGQPLTLGGKPEVLYIGADYCPFCAAERWSLVVALSKFGTFSNLSYMLSAPNDLNLSTVTFFGSSYTSSYISFVAVEETDRLNQITLQIPTQDQQAIFSKYNPGLSIPFVDIGNQYAVIGSEYLATIIQNLNWTQIGSQLDNPNSKVAQAIDGAANTLITAICKVDGQQPSSVCSQSFAKLSLIISPSLSQSGPLSIGVPTSDRASLRLPQ